MAVGQIVPGATFEMTPSAGAGATVGMSIFSTLFGLYSTRQQAQQYDAAAAEAERIGRQNATAIEAETQENIRRTALDQQASEATARARMAASGVSAGGSMSNAINTMTTENTRQLAWMNVSGESQARSAITGGKYTAATARANASAIKAKGIAGGIKSGFKTYQLGKKYTNWWGK